MTREQEPIELRETEALLLECQRLGRTGYVIVDYVNQRVTWSETVFDIRRVPHRESPGLQQSLDFIHPEDRPNYLAEREAAIAARRDFEIDVRVLRGDGTIGWEHILGHPRFDESGNLRNMLVVLRDISEEKKTEIALRESRALLLESQRIGKTGYMLADFANDRVYWSESLFEFLRVPPRPYLNFEEARAFIHPDDVSRYLAIRNKALAEGQPFEAEMRTIRGDGSTGWAYAFGHPRFGHAGNLTGMLVVLRDITAEKLAAKALEERERHLSAIMDNAPVGIYLKDREGRYLRTNRQMDVFGAWSGINTAGKRFDQLLANELVEMIARTDREVLESGKTISIDTPTFSGRDDYTHATLTKFPVRNDAGEIVGIAGFITNITERHRAEQALRQRETDFRAITDNAPLAIFLKDRNGRYRLINRRFAEWSGLRPEEVVGHSNFDIFPPALAEWTATTDRKVLEQGEVSDAEEPVGVRPNVLGGIDRVRVTKFPIRDDDGNIVGIAGFTTDITARSRAEQALRKSEERFRALIEQSNDLIMVVDENSIVRYASPAVTDVFGVVVEETLGRPISDFLHPDDVDRMAAAHRSVSQAVGNQMSDQVRVRHEDGSWRIISWSARNAMDVAGVEGIIINGRDVTEARNLEEQLQQAQKMEAVGQLTGGIAHDFNNLLGVVSGNLELLGERLAPDAEQRVLLDRALAAVDRGANLTRSLLAFARKQPLSPVPLDANRLINETAELFRRPLGERIELVTVTSGGLWLCEADPTQLQAAVLNLLVNARDAMPDGGKITLETANVRLDDEYSATHAEVTPGLYVLIAVSDTGRGMPSEVMKHAFEPFFSTKGPGVGSGLGLSMVYGFVKQSGGQVKIYSEVGKGTSIKIYLPRAASAAGDTVATPLEPGAASPRGETILLVEDEAEFRATVATMLREAGYAVIEAATADAALAHLREAAAPNLLLTDVILPGAMNGVELTRAAAALYPGLAMMFMSGYTENSIIHHGRVDPGVILLQKPFRKVDLLNKIRQALGR